MTWRIVRWATLLAGGTLVTLAIIAGFGSRTATLRALVIQTLAARLDSEVEMDAFSVDTFPTVHVTGAGLTIRHRGRRDVPPLVSIKSFSLDGGLFGMLSRPRRFRTVTITGLQLNIPPGGFKRTGDQSTADAPPSTAAAKQDDATGPAAIVVDNLIADDAQLVLIPRRADKKPKVFDVHRLEMQPLGRAQVMSYKATITNPLPKGLVEAAGTFGPWGREDPGSTPLTGKYTFNNADLSTVKGIGGMLNSTGTFGGQLDRIAVSGETHTPDFRLKVAAHPVPLDTKFDAVVDGTDGDTYLNAVSATFLNTPLTARGAIIGEEGVKGRTVKVHVKIDAGRIEDVLRLAVKGDKPLMRGRLALHSDLNLPAGPAEVMDRLELNGEFGVAAAKFNGEVQEKISNLSERARGLDPEEHGDNVVSNLHAKFQLQRGVLTLRDAAFGIPGATVAIAGSYGLEHEALEFDGTVRMQATISEAAGGGLKGFFLKAVDPLFRKQGAGAVLPIRIRGTREAPKFGLDVKQVIGKK